MNVNEHHCSLANGIKLLESGLGKEEQAFENEEHRKKLYVSYKNGVVYVLVFHDYDDMKDEDDYDATGDEGLLSTATWIKFITLYKGGFHDKLMLEEP